MEKGRKEVENPGFGDVFFLVVVLVVAVVLALGDQGLDQRDLLGDVVAAMASKASRWDDSFCLASCGLAGPVCRLGDFLVLRPSRVKWVTPKTRKPHLGVFIRKKLP